MPEIMLERPQAKHAHELGRICFEAFKDISEKHGFLSDFHSLDFAHSVISSSIANESNFSVAAILDGRPAGSNFMSLTDDVAGIGPVSVDPPAQGFGIGRRLMVAALEHARENGLDRVRLVQDAFNTTSMSLYASLGFDTTAPLGMLEVRPAEHPDERIRPMAPDDINAADAMCREMYKISRRDGIARAPQIGFTPLVLERGGRMRAYLVPGIIGHGVAETEEDMLALMAEGGRVMPFPVTQLLPLTEGNLFRKALAAGHRLRKMMNLMALGAYEEPEGVWVPSVMY